MGNHGRTEEKHSRPRRVFLRVLGEIADITVVAPDRNRIGSFAPGRSARINHHGVRGIARAWLRGGCIHFLVFRDDTGGPETNAGSFA